MLSDTDATKQSWELMMKLAALRVCASCEWIFKMTHTVECPRCGFGTYGAHFVYGNNAYRYAKTQKPWFNKQMSKAAESLRLKAKENPCCYKATYTNGWHHDHNCPKHVMCD